MADGMPLPKIKEGAFGEWILSAFDLVEAPDRVRLTMERRVPFLGRGTPIWIRVDGKKVPQKLRGRLTTKTSLAGAIDSVCVTLQENLDLILRPNADAKLAECPCSIPALNTEAKSLNHAYTLVSRKFEPTRRSYGGNVFQHVYYEESQQRVLPLDTLRLRTELIYVPSEASCLLESSLFDVWMRHAKNGTGRREPNAIRRAERFPFPEKFSGNQALKAIGKEYEEFLVALMARNKEDLAKTYNRFHDPEEQSPDILRLRELHAAMDRAVLDAYGWTDLQPTCEFLLDYEEEEDEDDTPAKGRGRKKPWRYRWPDDFRDEVLDRLLELKRQYAKAERLSGAAVEKKGKKTAFTTKGTKNNYY